MITRDCRTDFDGEVFVPDVEGVRDTMERLLYRYDVMTIFRQTHKVQQHLKHGRMPGIWSRLVGYTGYCACAAGVCVGTMKRSGVSPRISEHRCSCWLSQLEKLALVEHVLSHYGHIIWFEETKILAAALHDTSAMRGYRDMQAWWQHEQEGGVRVFS